MRSNAADKDSLLLVPLRKVCKTVGEVTDLLQHLMEDVKNKRRLSGFQAAKNLQRGVAGALVDSVILQPKLGGVGFDLKKFFTDVKK
jgi:hypothetical protein